MTTQTFELTPKQREANALLASGHRHTLLAGGSRSGKTFLLVRAVVIRALKAANSRHAILRFRYNAVRASVGLDTLPTVMRLCFPQIPLNEHRQDGYFELPNKAQIWLGGLDDKERVEKILGQEYATLYFNECSQIPYSSILVARTRLAQSVGLQQKAFYDLNPPGTGHWSYKEFVEGKEPRSMERIADPENYAFAYINPADNAANLDEAYLQSLKNLPEKQRRRFYEGRYIAEVDGALWTIDMIDAGRVTDEDVPELKRIVVAVDPSGASGPEDYRSDEIGIVAAGLGVDDHAYILADRTVRAGPAGWGKVAVDLHHALKGDRIIAEKNYGGAMVEHVIRTTNRKVPVRLITASRGKTVRAEPVASLYETTPERGPMVHHVGRYPEMEDEMSNFSVAGYQGDRSPNRADALVWAITELMLGDAGTLETHSIRGLM